MDYTELLKQKLVGVEARWSAYPITPGSSPTATASLWACSRA